MVKEPEAAALYTMHTLGFSLKAGDTFIVCDAGGGTVDLISYEVIAVEPSLELKELVPGKGVDICLASPMTVRFYVLIYVFRRHGWVLGAESALYRSGQEPRR